MQDLSAIEIKYLKKLKRNPNGVTDEEAENLLQEVQAEIMKKSLAFELEEKRND